MRARGLAVTAAALLIALAGCSADDDSPSPSPSIDPSSTSASAPAPATSGPATTVTVTATQPTTLAPYDAAPTSSSPAQPEHGYHVTQTRVASHDGFDRAVIELSGGSASGLEWLAEYDPNPATQGKGEAVDLPGNATLRLIVRGLVIPPPVNPPTGMQPNSIHGTITALYADPVFEGQAVFFIGVEQQAPFHVFTLDSPTRVVIDFQT